MSTAEDKAAVIGTYFDLHEAEISVKAAILILDKALKHLSSEECPA